MTKIKILILLLAFVLAGFASEAQSDSDGSDSPWLKVGMTNFSVGYGWEFPLGDLADRFDDNLKFTVGLERITASDWIYGVEFAFMFGDTVKEDVLAPLRLSNNEVLGADNAYADVFMRERGMFLGANFGKLIRLGRNSRSGIRITGAAGLLAHYIRIADEASSTPQIEGAYLKGYDRLTRGLAFREFVGYQHISQDKRVNFYIGLEFTQGFTRHVRAFDFDTGLPSDQSGRFDGLISLKAAWILPFYDDYQDSQVFY